MGDKENREKERRRLPKLKNPAEFWKKRRERNRKDPPGDELDFEEALQQEEEEEEHLEEVSRRLILREEQLFSQGSPSEEEEDDLYKDSEALRLQLWVAVHNTFTSSSSSSSSAGPMEILRSAVASIQQQEVQDRRWAGCPEDQVPVWRPQRCLRTHNTLVQKMVESRLTKATEEDSAGAEGLSSPLKRKVCRMGKRVKEDLLTVVRQVNDCYPPQMDVVNLYAGLYHQSFSSRLAELSGQVGLDDCSYLLLWTNHCYPREILNHQDLEGKIKTACLGSLLLPDLQNRLETQYLTHKEEQLRLWLNTALKKEEESWMNDRKHELIDQYCFSPLAIDVIQVIDSTMTEFNCVIGDKSKGERITAHLESFLSSYKNSLGGFVKGNHGNARSVVKAQLVCEQQLRDYITGRTGSLSEQQKDRCLDTLSALWDCGYSCLTGPIQMQLKVCLSPLWTSAWLDESLPVVDSLLDALNKQLSDLTDLKPACRQSLLCGVHRDVVLHYVRGMMKTRMKGGERQVRGAQRMMEDARKINDFFDEGGCSESLWLDGVLRSLAEILRLQDPESLQLEMVGAARAFPDLSDAHVSVLLALKAGLSAADVRSIRRSVEENRLLDVSTNHGPAFFSKVKVKWINNRINRM
ncbi:tumor necrosis factor alpha-induced protein 2-like [Brachionichthys hirsutus]|uniref:tumor necrosis factor alpha-induced protein 2-like n=1 Tax=Brachionichthys hirsutus TaxID=412623 RepID=UPI003604B564